MEIDECSVNGDSGAEEDEDEELSQGSGTESSSNNSSNSSTTTDSGEESADEQATSSSESNSSLEEEEEENDASEHLEERRETCVAGGTRVKLPQDLCEHASIFKEMLDYPKFWDELSESQKESLYSYLPNFPKDCNIEAELDKTLDMLFQREITRFGVNPLDDFHKHLSAGHYRPDIKKMRSCVKKAQKRKFIFEERKRAYELTSQLLKSRENLLSNAYKQGFSQPSHRTLSKMFWKKPKPDLLEERTSLRYTEELNAINIELGSSSQLGGTDSDSEDDDNGNGCLMTPAQASTGGKLQQQMQLIQQQRRKKRAALIVQKQQQLTLTTKAMHFNLGDEDLRPVYSTLQRIGTECGSVGVGTGLASITIRPELSEESYRSMLVTHKKRRARRDNHPELNTQGIALSDLMQRAQLGQKHKLTFTSRTPTTKKRIKVEAQVQQPFQQQQYLHQAVMPHKICTTPVKMESDTNSHTSGDYSLHSTDDLKHSVIEQPDQKPPERILAEDMIKDEPIELMEQKYEIEPPAAQPPPTLMDEETEPIHDNIASPIRMMDIKEELPEIDYETNVKVENSVVVHEEIPVSVSIPLEVEEEIDKKELDLDSIDMMQLPIQLDDGIDILADVKCEDGNIISLPDKDMANSIVQDIVMNGDELMQETHMCFFSLIRDSFMSKGEYRMDRDEMKDAVVLWQDNPISPLNDWYSLVPSWPSLVPLALGFLAGELIYPSDPLLDGDQELVPYLENKGQGIYAWIGAGRDSDSRLSILCNKFLLYKDSLVSPKPPSASVSSIKQQSQQIQYQQQQQLSQDLIGVADISNSIDSAMILDSSAPEWEPPRALCPTDWKVRPSTVEEREEFHRQERLRYAAPHKAFTYRMHGYSSVVGPVKGIYQHNAGTAMAKARGHSLLVPDRPNFVTILALVRDATARLPNGEGTRADICTLLKDSQYIQEHMFSNDKEANLNSVVSGALDRLHYEHDPCVRYYPKRKEWLYLHRARSEPEFEMFHQQLQGIPKNKKTSGSSSRSKTNSSKTTNTKDTNAPLKEPTPKKEKKSQISSSRKEQKKIEEKISSKQIEQTLPNAAIIQQQSSHIQQVPQTVQQVLQAPKLTQLSQVTTTTPQTTIPITITMHNSNNPVSAAMLSIVTTTTPATSTVTAQTILSSSGSSVTTTNASILPSITTVASTVSNVEKESPVTAVPSTLDSKTQFTVGTNRDLNTITTLTSPTPIKKSNVNIKSVAVVKPGGQSLLQSNQQHFPHQQIQVSTSAGLQTIRLSGHSVLQSSQPIASASSTTVGSIFTSAAKVIQSQASAPQQQTVLSTQAGKSLLQTSNLKPQSQIQPQQILPGKTLLASGIKLVSSGQIKSLLTSHGLQGQTIFIKQPAAASSTSQAQTPQAQTQRVVQAATLQQQQRVVQTTTTPQRIVQAANSQQQQSLQNSGMQRIIAQIGGKPIAVQIQQSPHQQQQSQQPQQQKVLAKVLSNTGTTSQLISVESLLAQKGLKLATTTAHPNQLTRQGNKVIQAQYQVVTQAQSISGQPKIIVSSQSPQTQQTQGSQQQPTANQQTVRMLTAQLAGKPIVLASSPTGKTVTGNVVLGKQTAGTAQTGQQQPIILPSQLLNIKTLHGLKVISTPSGLKTAGAAVYARVLTQTTVAQTQNQSNVVTVQQQQSTGQPQQSQSSTVQQSPQIHQLQQQNSRNSPFGGTQ